MRTLVPTRRRWLLALVLGGVVSGGGPWLPRTGAYPPAPYHIIYGLVRDGYGTPLMSPDASVVLETPSGVQLTTSLVPGLGPDRNYKLQVPMDSGLTPDAYIPTALETSVPFKLYVVQGVTTNLPIQMSGSFPLLGVPGKQTRLDLTLGVDANGDGIPDAWEYAFLAALGSNLALNDLKPSLVLTPDGLTLRQEYLLGNYPFNPGAAFKVTLVELDGDSPLLEFTTMTGRSYTVLGSADLTHWTPLTFRLPTEGPSGNLYSYYTAVDIHAVQVQALQPMSGPAMRFFTVLLQ